MNLLNRVFISQSRKFGKSLILFAIVLALGIVISAAISMQQAFQNTENSIRGSVPAVVAIEADEEAIEDIYSDTGQWPVLNPFTMDMLAEIGALSYVRNYNISLRASLLSSDLDRVAVNGFVSGEKMGEWENFDLQGIYGEGFLDEEEGIIEIVYGRSFSAEEIRTHTSAGMISRELAAANGLGIGSTITLDNIYWDTRGVYDISPDFFTEENIFARESYDLEVIGIFEKIAEINTGDEWMDNNFTEEIINRIYVPHSIVLSSLSFQFENDAMMFPVDDLNSVNPEDRVFLFNAFSLHDVSYVDNFKARAYEIIPPLWRVADGSDSYNYIISSMQTFNHLANILLVMIVGAGILIIGLLITLILRENKREIGIYLALGEKKARVIAQMIVETVSVAVAALITALFVGNILADSISETMLRNSMIAEQGHGEMMTFGLLDQMGIIRNAPIDEMLAMYSVTLDIATALTFFAIGVTTVLAATVAPMLYIVKQSPKKIMM